MEWLRTNYVEVFAVIGALYSAARAITYLTPTPKDDHYVKQVGIWLRVVMKAFGLDMKQGLKKKCKS